MKIAEDLEKNSIKKEEKDSILENSEMQNLSKEYINAEVINARFLKPLDKETIKKSIVKTKNVITIEDGTIINGLSTAIKELIIDEKLEDIQIKSYAYPDEFIKHGGVEELEEIYKVDEKSIVKEIEKSL